MSIFRTAMMERLSSAASQRQMPSISFDKLQDLLL